MASIDMMERVEAVISIEDMLGVTDISLFKDVMLCLGDCVLVDEDYIKHIGKSYLSFDDKDCEYYVFFKSKHNKQKLSINEAYIRLYNTEQSADTFIDIVRKKKI